MGSVREQASAGTELRARADEHVIYIDRPSDLDSRIATIWPAKTYAKKSLLTFAKT